MKSILAIVLIAAGIGSAQAAEHASGCGKLPPESPPAQVSVDAEVREVIAVVPGTYTPEHADRLVLAFHGRTSPAEQVRQYYGLEGIHDADTIFVYPKALRQADGTFVWRMPEDFALFDAIVERFTADYCIAKNKIYAVGHSLGATFANSLACARGTGLRAVLTVAGGIGWSDCAGAAAALLLHNPEDELVPISEGLAALQALLAQNELGEKPDAGYSKPFDCRRFGVRGKRNPIVWCLYDQSYTGDGRYYPHLWPEGTEQLALKFFEALD